MTHPPSAESLFPLRLWAAFAVVPVVGAGVAYLCFPLVRAMGWHGGSPWNPGGAAYAFAVLSGVLAFLVTWTVAVPVVIWLKKRGPISLPKALVAGLLLGNAPFGFYVIVFVLPATMGHLGMGTLSQHLAPLSELAAATLRIVLIGSAMGALSGAVVWFLGIAEGG